MFSRGDFKIKRSPCRVCWHILFNGKFITTAMTKREANATVEELAKTAGIHQ